MTAASTTAVVRNKFLTAVPLLPRENANVSRTLSNRGKYGLSPYEARTVAALWRLSRFGLLQCEKVDRPSLSAKVETDEVFIPQANFSIVHRPFTLYSSVNLHSASSVRLPPSLTREGFCKSCFWAIDKYAICDRCDIGPPATRCRDARSLQV